MDRVLPGSSTDLLIDLPPLRLPRPRNVLTKTYHKTMMFLKEVSLYFVAGALLLSVLQVTGALAGPAGPADAAHGRLAAAARAQASNAFVMGFVRRDFGAAGLYDLGLGQPADPRGPGDDHPVRALHRLRAHHHEGARQALHRRSSGWAASGSRSSSAASSPGWPGCCDARPAEARRGGRNAGRGPSPGRLSGGPGHLRPAHLPGLRTPAREPRPALPALPRRHPAGLQRQLQGMRQGRGVARRK